MTETTAGKRQGRGLLLLLTLFAMMAAGVVLAVSWLVAIPAAVLAVAAVVALVGLSIFSVAGVRQARQSGDGVLRSVGRALRGVVRLAFDLF